MGVAFDALAAERDELIRICQDVSPADWAAETGCPGWSVKDLVAHLGALFWAAVDPSVLPDTTALATEHAQDVIVQSRRPLTAGEVLDDYAAISEKALPVLAALSLADFEMALGDLGTYPARAIPSAFCFDHYTHIRADLLGPRGPLSGAVPPSDELRLVPALDWIEAALPQQNREVTAGLRAAAAVHITGLAARIIRIGPSGGSATAAVRCDADTCVRWITQRGTWEDLGVQAEGDPAALAAVRELKVF